MEILDGTVTIGLPTAQLRQMSDVELDEAVERIEQVIKPVLERLAKRLQARFPEASVDVSVS